ncbi:protein kinase domain-containing protein [Actinoplanes sp. G11-F43]|uniref:serine/threonine-protein kinase n=1 Tax=Actinoplanes sp. G11-F43 TaxID=3424130 RepID=UPI003D3561F2
MPHPGEMLGGRYRLDDPIAAGGMGEVWQATDTVLGRPVAVKTLLADRASDPGFRHEAQALAALRHPGVVPVYDFGNTEAEDAYLVMAHVDGRPLNHLLADRGRLDPAETMAIVAQAGRALETAHAAGIVHRDVKPGNLIVEPDGTVVLVDFGVARSARSATLTGAREVVGTALYIAPEQITRQETGPAADVYALGALAYHCLAGHPPFQGANPIAVALQHIEDPPPPLPDDVPAVVVALVERALAKDPGARFPSAGSMAEAAHQAEATQRTEAAHQAEATQQTEAAHQAEATQRTEAAHQAGAAQQTEAGHQADATQQTEAGQVADTTRSLGSTQRTETISRAGAAAYPAGPGAGRSMTGDERSGTSGDLTATRAGAPWLGVSPVPSSEQTGSGGAGGHGVPGRAAAPGQPEEEGMSAAASRRRWLVPILVLVSVVAVGAAVAGLAGAAGLFDDEPQPSISTPVAPAGVDPPAEKNDGGGEQGTAPEQVRGEEPGQRVQQGGKTAPARSPEPEKTRSPQAPATTAPTGGETSEAPAGTEPTSGETGSAEPDDEPEPDGETTGPGEDEAA